MCKLGAGSVLYSCVKPLLSVRFYTKYHPPCVGALMKLPAFPKVIYFKEGKGKREKGERKKDKKEKEKVKEEKSRW